MTVYDPFQRSSIYDIYGRIECSEFKKYLPSSADSCIGLKAEIQMESIYYQPELLRESPIYSKHVELEKFKFNHRDQENVEYGIREFRKMENYEG